MKFETLYNYLKEKNFVVVDMKSGNVTKDGFIYDIDFKWTVSGDLSDTESFDSSVERFISQMPRRFMVVRLVGNMYQVIPAQIGTQSFVAGWMKRGGDEIMVSATGREIFLR